MIIFLFKVLKQFTGFHGKRLEDLEPDNVALMLRRTGELTWFCFVLVEELKKIKTLFLEGCSLQNVTSVDDFLLKLPNKKSFLSNKDYFDG